MASLLAVQRSTELKDKGSDQAAVATPSAKFLKAFSGAKGLMPTRRSKALPCFCPSALPCHYNYLTALPCPTCLLVLHALPCLVALPCLTLLLLMAIAAQSAC